MYFLLKIFVQFQACKNLYNPKKQENIITIEKFWKKSFVTKTFGSDTVIGPWFRFPIPKPSFGCTLVEGKHIEYRNMPWHSKIILFISSRKYLKLICKHNNNLRFNSFCVQKKTHSYKNSEKLLMKLVKRKSSFLQSIIANYGELNLGNY